jgi:hypothetical protein
VLTLVTDSGIRADQFVRLHPSITPAPSGSGEIVLQGEDGECLLVLRVTHNDGHSSSSAVVTFHRCLQTVFGYPNDEARAGDERQRDNGYGFYEITNSPWVGRLQSYNRKAFPPASGHTSGEEWPFGTLRHFVVRTHENTREFLAADMTIDVEHGSFATAAAKALAKLVQ